MISKENKEIILINPKKKQDFITFLIAKKYLNKEIKFTNNSNSDLRKEFIKLLNNEKIIKYLNSMEIKNYDLLKSTLENLEKLLDNNEFDSNDNNIYYDYIFSKLYSSPIFLNMVKKRQINDFIFEEYCMFLNRVELFINEFNEASLEQNEKSKDQGKFTFFISGLVITRFPPEPSGYLHIGHARAALLNEYFAKVNNGKLLVRFDDTNQNKDYEKYEKIILEDLSLLGINNYKLSSTSDHFEYLIESCRYLINKGMAFCDDTEVIEMRKKRELGEPSNLRNLTIEENLKIFEKLIYQKNIKYLNPNELFCIINNREIFNKDLFNFCIRAKIDYKSKNGTLRDPVIFRQNLKSHHKTGDKYNLYPTYDFAIPLVDSKEGVTFCLRTTEFHDRNEQYEWILNQFNLKKITIYDFGRLNFENTCLSKRKLKYFIDDGLVSNWDDPRIPTIRGLMRLGLTIESLKEYILMQGTPRNPIQASWDKIWSINKRNIDLNAKRLSCIYEENYIKLNIINSEIPNNFEVPFYKKNIKLGNKIIFTDNIIISQNDGRILEVNEEFTLMNLCNAIVINKTYHNEILISITIKLNPNGDFKITNNKINFISLNNSENIKIIKYGNLLLLDKNNESTEDLRNSFNKESKLEIKLIGESSIKEIKKGEICQFERIGFFIRDSDSELIFNLIPFTEQKRKF